MKQDSRKIKAQNLDQRLNFEIARPRTWRDVARDYPEIVKAGTLNRIAKSDGAWLPKKHEVLSALGLLKTVERQADWQRKVKKSIALMAKATRESMQV